MGARLTCWLAAAVIPAAVAAQSGQLGFEAAGDEFVFDTGVLRGKAREGRRAIGLTQVTHVPSEVTISSGFGLVGHYRVFTRGRRYGDGAWYWPGEARLNPNKELEVSWPAAEGRPFELRARYRWLAPEALEVETQVSALEELVDFESFLASYLIKNFNFAAALAGQPARWIPADPEFGVWQMFPRDSTAHDLIRDGRWKIPPSPVEWAIRPKLADPIVVRVARDLGLAVALMAPREDCFAVATPHHHEQHYSLYLSLFGKTIPPGETARARALLVVLKETDGHALERACRKWLGVLSASPGGRTRARR